MVAKKIIVIAICSILGMTLLQSACAGDYYYTGWAEIDRAYNKVGVTPQKIYLKTKYDFYQTIFNQQIFSGKMVSLLPKKLTVVLLYWHPIYNIWMPYKSKTYYNEYNMLGYPTKLEFSSYAHSYHDPWYAFWTYWLMIEYTLNLSANSLPIENHIKQMIYVEVIYDGNICDYTRMSFEPVKVRVTGYGQFSPYGATTWSVGEEYPEPIELPEDIIIPQSILTTPPENETTIYNHNLSTFDSPMWFMIFAMISSIISYSLVYRKKRY